MRQDGSHFCAYICSLFLVYVTGIERCNRCPAESQRVTLLFRVCKSFVQHCSIAKFKGTETPAILYTGLGSLSWCHGSGRWLEHLVGRGLKFQSLAANLEPNQSILLPFSAPAIVIVPCAVASTSSRYGGISTSAKTLAWPTDQVFWFAVWSAPRVRELKLPSSQCWRHRAQRLYPCFDGWIHGAKTILFDEVNLTGSLASCSWCVFCVVHRCLPCLLAHFQGGHGNSCRAAIRCGGGSWSCFFLGTLNEILH